MNERIVNIFGIFFRYNQNEVKGEVEIVFVRNVTSPNEMPVNKRIHISHQDRPGQARTSQDKPGQARTSQAPPENFIYLILLPLKDTMSPGSSV
jgi:hypothetical protein